jgi:hypothetical protein
MAYLIGPSERESFKRCRRQWDFGARGRRHLEPDRPPSVIDFGRAIQDALAVYYFPGMWDWQRSVVLPIALDGFVKSMRRQRDAAAAHGPLAPEQARAWDEHLDLGTAVLRRYFEWAPSVDRFAPIRVETDFEIDVPDPEHPERGLTTADGQAVRYGGRVDLLAVDEHDAYWVVQHRVTTELPDGTGHLLLDESSVAACWAWELFYLGMGITGTVYNELSTAEPPPSAPAPRSRWAFFGHPRGGLAQHEPSGGGRAIPYHRRAYAQAREPEVAERVRQTTGAGFRRTWVRRGPDEVARMGAKVTLEALDMVDPGLRLYPSPAPEACARCDFVAPCVALDAGAEVETALAAEYRERRELVEDGRLGGTTWGMGRGAMPPRFGSGPQPGSPRSR